MLSQEKLAEIKKALEAATPGPWFTGSRGGQCHINHKHGNGDCVYDLVLTHSDDWVESTQPDHEIFEYDYDGARIKRKEDAHLIANAPTWIQQLLETVSAKDAEIEQLKSERHKDKQYIAENRDAWIDAKAALAIAVEALEKYGDMIVVDQEDRPHDVGHLAREAISRINSKED